MPSQKPEESVMVYKVRKKSTGKYLSLGGGYGLSWTKSGETFETLQKLMGSLSEHVRKKSLAGDDVVVVRFVTRTVDHEIFPVEELPEKYEMILELEKEQRDYADYVRLLSKYEPEKEPVPFPLQEKADEMLPGVTEVQAGSMLDTLLGGDL